MGSFDTRAVRLLTLLTVAVVAVPSTAEITGTTRVANLPGGSSSDAVFVTHAPGRPNDLFVVDQRGLIQVLDLDTLTFGPTPFLDIQGLVDDGGSEQGLLGLAFDPDYANNGYFYVNYTRDPGPGLDRTRIDRFQAPDPLNATGVSAGTRHSILEFEQDFSNHNAGWIGFSPKDDLLYISSGDGGSGNDPNNRGQSLDTRLGKMLRVDPHGDDFPLDSVENYAVPAGNPFADDGDPDTLAEIWSYGLRNPWRNSFDRETGDLWIGDVGQGTREEINRIDDGQAGANFGWRLREGDVIRSGGATDPPGYVPPVYDYLSNENPPGPFAGNSTVGGYVYRGPDVEVQGRYFFGDSFPSRLWSFDPADPDGTVENLDSLLNPTGAINTPVSFGEDAAGNLYIVNLNGTIFRIDTTIPGDANRDGVVDLLDLDILGENFGRIDAAVKTFDEGDFNLDQSIDLLDLDILGANFGSGTSAIPEPATAMLVACGTLMVLRGRAARAGR
ncbi:MAG: PQQ-dependent sugar dehydrogenase [Planctomycetota bacterium]